jgi:hydroxyacylglutathione hydrolase
MNKTFKRILLVSGIVFGIIVLLLIGFMIMSKSEIDSMSPLETKEVIKNITSVKDKYVNMYLIKDEDSYIAIDAGDDIEIIEQEFKKIKINPDKVTAVFLTHTDFDHVAAIGLFKNADIYLSKQEEQLINGETSRFYIIGNSLNTEDYTLLKDGQIINIGNTKIQGILIPGHTPGAMCYQVNDTSLFTGDVLSLQNGKIDKFNEMFNMDTETAIKSLDKLTNIPDVKHIFTAHHGYAEFKSAIKNWKK